MMDVTTEGVLELKSDDVGSNAYHLDGEPLRNGDSLSVMVNGVRTRGVFAWSGQQTIRPRLASRFWKGGSTGFNFPIARDASCTRDTTEPAAQPAPRRR